MSNKKIIVVNKTIQSSETRTKALDWFNSLSLEEKFYQVIPWLRLKGLNVTDRHPNSLTGREIEDIYLNKK